MNKGHGYPLSSALISRQLEEAEPLEARYLLVAPTPPRAYWRTITNTAEDKKPWSEAYRKLIPQALRKRRHSWPCNWREEVDESLPALTRAETLAILDRFLHTESGGLNGGVKLHRLQWLALTTAYCPRREQYKALGQLVRSGLLEEAEDATEIHRVPVRFPLVVTLEGVEAIQELRARAEAERSWPKRMALRFQDWIREQERAFPTLVSVGRTVTADVLGRAIAFAVGVGVGLFI